MKSSETLSLMEPGGESNGGFIVNTSSKFEKSSSLRRTGLKGGSVRRFMTSSHLTAEKKRWLLMPLASSGPNPRRFSIYKVQYVSDIMIQQDDHAEHL
jgi:hypothetical protein